ncbi:prenylated rab acceptor family [Micractinium conductrix]|uniref:PRA1 family protein n=1 Tax=Micractinium conductrix TaxID=554055 RepID=A0A2P6V9G6_9CHLO|nr:prenylated rab acceptor family [Micractinium conductrix]|eukprot:PSC70728.1 prenylated rab acceptor family [Micractinium conductrix]
MAEAGGQPAESAELVASRAGAVLGFAAKLKENAAQSFKEAKPWAEVFDRTAFGKPSGMAEATGRLRKNVSYFKVNYGIVGVSTTALVMFMNPWSLIVLAVLALLWGYAYIVRTSPIVLGGRKLSDREKFLALSGTSLVVVFFLTSVGATMFYALGLSMLLIGAHAALRVPDDLFLDEAPEQQSGGFLSLLTGGSKPMAAVVANAV